MVDDSKSSDSADLPAGCSEKEAGRRARHGGLAIHEAGSGVHERLPASSAMTARRLSLFGRSAGVRAWTSMSSAMAAKRCRDLPSSRSQMMPERSCCLVPSGRLRNFHPVIAYCLFSEDGQRFHGHPVVGRFGGRGQRTHCACRLSAAVVWPRFACLPSS